MKYQIGDILVKPRCPVLTIIKEIRYDGFPEPFSYILSLYHPEMKKIQTISYLIDNLDKLIKKDGYIHYPVKE